MSRHRIHTPKAVFEVLYELARAHGIPPSQPELAAALKVGSCLTVRRYLDDLESRGWIRRHPGARGIQILKGRKR